MKTSTVADSFEYTIEDEDGLQDTATVTITVNPVNDAPVANDDIASTDEDNALTVDVLDNDTDVDGDELTVVSTTEPSNGSVVINEDGTVTYTPNENFNGTDSFEYTIEDEDGLQDTATVTITVNPVNDAPVANDDTASTDEDNVVTVDVLDNDTDVDGDELTVVSTTQPSNGNVAINEDGTITYTPNENFNGTDSFEYTIEDEDGLQDTATVTITVNSVNDGLVANDDFATTDEGVSVDINILANDSDPDGDQFAVESFTQPSNGNVTVNLDGTYKYTPAEGFNGTDTFTYTITDGEVNSTATVTITVDGNPMAQDDEATTEFETTVTVDVLDNDSDDEGEVEITEVTDPSNGTVTLNDDGTITYTPNDGFEGEDTFTYTITDNSGKTDTATVTVTVTEEQEEEQNPPAAPEADVVVEATCASPTASIQVVTQDGLEYSIDGMNYQTSGLFEGLAPGAYDVTARDSVGQISESEIIIILEPIAEEIELVDNGVIDLCTEDSVFDLFELFAGDYDETGVWLDTENTGALDNGFVDPSLLTAGEEYTFEYQITGICNSTTEVTVMVNDDCIVLDCSLTDLKDSISKAVTPNGDNRNDFFEVDLDTECGFTYDLKIFNRWGAEVYTAQNYQNDWDGFSKSSFTSSNQLPSGTYYYILEIRNSEFEPIQGYIYLGTK